MSAWDSLYQTASAQAGHFTTQQAAEAGYSTQLLLKHIRAGRLVRVRHGIYRLVHFPAGEHEELAVVWLWSEHKGVFSHQTALGLTASLTSCRRESTSRFRPNGATAGFVCQRVSCCITRGFRTEIGRGLGLFRSRRFAARSSTARGTKLPQIFCARPRSRRCVVVS